MKNSAKSIFFALFLVMAQNSLYSQNSIPFQWTEAMLTAIRNDFARPPMTARNLQHFSMAMYDAWAAYDSVASTVFLGRTFNGFFCPYNGIEQPEDILSAQNEALSFAAYRIIRNRYINSPGWNSVTNSMLMMSILLQRITLQAVQLHWEIILQPGSYPMETQMAQISWPTMPINIMFPQTHRYSQHCRVLLVLLTPIVGKP